MGKTHSVRELAQREGYQLIEINLDLEATLHTLFALEPRRLLSELYAIKGSISIIRNRFSLLTKFRRTRKPSLLYDILKSYFLNYRLLQRDHYSISHSVN